MPDPKPRRGMPRSLIYAMIPAGFVLLVILLILSGFLRQEAEEDVPADEAVIIEE